MAKKKSNEKLIFAVLLIIAVVGLLVFSSKEASVEETDDFEDDEMNIAGEATSFATRNKIHQYEITAYFDNLSSEAHYVINGENSSSLGKGDRDVLSTGIKIKQNENPVVQDWSGMTGTDFTLRRVCSDIMEINVSFMHNDGFPLSFNINGEDFLLDAGSNFVDSYSSPTGSFRVLPTQAHTQGYYAGINSIGFELLCE